MSEMRIDYGPVLVVRPLVGLTRGPRSVYRMNRFLRLFGPRRPSGWLLRHFVNALACTYLWPVVLALIRWPSAREVRCASRRDPERKDSDGKMQPINPDRWVKEGGGRDPAQETCQRRSADDEQDETADEKKPTRSPGSEDGTVHHDRLAHESRATRKPGSDVAAALSNGRRASSPPPSRGSNSKRA